MDIDPDSVDFETFVSNIPSKSSQDLKWKNLFTHRNELITTFFKKKVFEEAK